MTSFACAACGKVGNPKVIRQSTESGSETSEPSIASEEGADGSECDSMDGDGRGSDGSWSVDSDESAGEDERCEGGKSKSVEGDMEVRHLRRDGRNATGYRGVHAITVGGQIRYKAVAAARQRYAEVIGVYDTKLQAAAAYARWWQENRSPLSAEERECLGTITAPPQPADVARCVVSVMRGADSVDTLFRSNEHAHVSQFSLGQLGFWPQLAASITSAGADAAQAWLQQNVSGQTPKRLTVMLSRLWKKYGIAIHGTIGEQLNEMVGNRLAIVRQAFNTANNEGNGQHGQAYDGRLVIRMTAEQREQLKRWQGLRLHPVVPTRPFDPPLCAGEAEQLQEIGTEAKTTSMKVARAPPP